MRSHVGQQCAGAVRWAASGLLLAVTTTLSGCGSDTPPIVSLRGAADSTQLEIAVDTCNAHPTATIVEETPREVRVRVTAQRAWGDAECADSVVVSLSSPLRGRDVVDDTTDRSVEVVGRAG